MFQICCISRSLKLTQMYAIDTNPAFLSATMSCTIEELSGELSSSGCTVMRDGDQRIVFPEPAKKVKGDEGRVVENWKNTRHRSTAVAACDRLQWENGFPKQKSKRIGQTP
jgi:hypothetical protein